MEGSMSTRSVTLSQHQSELIDALVHSGRYQDEGEVLREGLRLIEQREAEDAARVQALREAVAAAEDDLAAGRYTSFSNTAELSAHLRGLARQALAEEFGSEG